MKTIRPLVALGVALVPAALMAQSANIQTFTYKKVGDLEIKLDVHRANDDAIRPLAVWIHGGALMGGGRQGIGRAGKTLLDAGYCVTSIDYRLAPESKLPAIISDLEDAFRWLRENAREKLKANPDRIAVMGESAGGYLALTAGFRVQPRPAAVIAFFGYGEVVGPWYADPSPHPRHLKSTMTDAEMAAIEAGPPVANSRDRKTGGGGYYAMTRRLGVWPIKVTGCDPVKEKSRFMPYMAAYNVTADYPPTLLIHGDADTDVPYEESVIMAREFTKHGVAHQLITIKGGEHGLSGGKPADVDAAFAALVPFIRSHLKSSP
jgi:acetyl esterase/lipase